MKCNGAQRSSRLSSLVSRFDILKNRADEQRYAECEYSSVITKNHKTLIAFGRIIN